MDKFDNISETFVLTKPLPDRDCSSLNLARFSLRYSYRGRLSRSVLGYYKDLPDANAALCRYSLLFPKYHFSVFPVLF